MKTMILAPHQDDEILGCCYYIHQAIEKGNDVAVVFATNGDHHGKEIAKIRYQESLSALRHLGLNANNIFYLGYGDTGMSFTKSFLMNLFLASPSNVFLSSCENQTYHPAGLQTVRQMATGKQGCYSKENFTQDLNYIINYFSPNEILCTSENDLHGDHCALRLFLKEIKLPANSEVHEYIIHSQNDSIWPNRNKTSFMRPDCVPENKWKQRISIMAPEALQDKKRKALQSFLSQQSTDFFKEYFERFVKEEEIFFPCKI